MVSMGCLGPEQGMVWTLDSGYLSEFDAWERAQELFDEGFVSIQIYRDSAKVYDEDAVLARLDHSNFGSAELSTSSRSAANDWVSSSATARTR